MKTATTTLTRLFFCLVFVAGGGIASASMSEYIEFIRSDSLGLADLEVRYYSPELKQKAEQGNADAQYALGNAYYHGFGIEGDKTKAAKWYRLAIQQYHSSAKQGDVAAQYKLGNAYVKGDAIEKNYTEAKKWYRLAAEQGHVDAQWKLGAIYSGLVLDLDSYSGSDYVVDFDSYDVVDFGIVDQAETVKWWSLAAEQGHFWAPRYLTGLNNKTQAMKWRRFVANAGDAFEQYNLALMFKEGKDVEKDEAEAAKWYHLAAEHGHPAAQEDLGKMYLSERASQDYSEAYIWLALADKFYDGEGYVAEYLQKAKKNLTSDQINQAQQQITQRFKKICATISDPDSASFFYFAKFRLDHNGRCAQRNMTTLERIAPTAGTTARGQ